MPKVKKREMTKLEATPYHENTKLACRLSGGLARRYFGWVRKPERRGGYIKRQALFRAFQFSCFRDWFYLFAVHSVFCLLYSVFLLTLL